jgi:hypothetical protein
MVLSTDMKQHFSIMSMFGTKIKSTEGTTTAALGSPLELSGKEGVIVVRSALDEEAKGLALQVKFFVISVSVKCEGYI